MSLLSEHPNWYYLIREIYNAYRFSSAGGSALIRNHQKEVRHRVARCLEKDPPFAAMQPETRPVCAHLAAALDAGRDENTRVLIQAVERIYPSLAWRYGYDKVPRGLERKYAFAEIMGPRGPVMGTEVILGLVLFAPRCVYPVHSHQGITESYLCLAGFCSENETGVFAPGSWILNRPGYEHRITTGDHRPCLLLYAWVGDPEVLSGQKMVFSRPAAPKKPPG